MTIPVLLQPDGSYERLTGNPTLTSLDGERRAPLRVILHESWSEADRAEFGVHLAERFVMPPGKVGDSEERFEGNGGVFQVYDVVDAPTPPPEPTPAERLEAATGLTVAEIRTVLGIEPPQ